MRKKTKAVFDTGNKYLLLSEERDMEAEEKRMKAEEYLISIGENPRVYNNSCREKKLGLTLFNKDLQDPQELNLNISLDTEILNGPTLLSKSGDLILIGINCNPKVNQDVNNLSIIKINAETKDISLLNTFSDSVLDYSIEDANGRINVIVKHYIKALESKNRFTKYSLTNNFTIIEEIETEVEPIKPLALVREEISFQGNIYFSPYKPHSLN